MLNLRKSKNQNNSLSAYVVGHPHHHGCPHRLLLIGLVGCGLTLRCGVGYVHMLGLGWADNPIKLFELLDYRDPLRLQLSCFLLEPGLLRDEKTSWSRKANLGWWQSSEEAILIINLKTESGFLLTVDSRHKTTGKVHMVSLGQSTYDDQHPLLVTRLVLQSSLQFFIWQALIRWKVPDATFKNSN